MSSPLQGSLAKQIGKAMSGLFYDATLSRSETTGGNPWDPNSGSTTTVDYGCRAFIDEPTQYELANSLVQANQGVVTILQTTLAVTPTTADKISIRGGTFTIAKISADPANATWRLIVNR